MPSISPFSRAVSVALAATLALAAPPAAADIVNIQPLLAPADDDGFHGELKGSLNSRTGNVDLFLASTALLMRYRTGLHRFISSSSYELGIKSGDEFIDRLFSHVRHQWLATELLTWETYGQIARDQFKRIQMRVLGGTGPRFELIDGPAVSAAVAVSYLFEHEEYSPGDYGDAGGTESNHRISAYVTGKFVIDPMLAFIHTTYFQPEATDPGDFRILSQSGLSIKLTDGLGLLVDFTLAYDSRPPESIERLDTTTNVSLAVSL